MEWDRTRVVLRKKSYKLLNIIIVTFLLSEGVYITAEVRPVTYKARV